MNDDEILDYHIYIAGENDTRTNTEFNLSLLSDRNRMTARNPQAIYLSQEQEETCPGYKHFFNY